MINNDELALKLKAAADKAVDIFDPNMFILTRDMAALLAERDADKKLIADSVVLFDTLRQRIAELEARTVSLTIKPPTIGRAYSALAHVWTVQEVREACTAAGIKLEVGE